MPRLDVPPAAASGPLRESALLPFSLRCTLLSLLVQRCVAPALTLNAVFACAGVGGKQTPRNATAMHVSEALTRACCSCLQTAFLMGMHKRAGRDSVLWQFHEDPMCTWLLDSAC